jgi:hypothetical protein
VSIAPECRPASCCPAHPCAGSPVWCAVQRRYHRHCHGGPNPGPGARPSLRMGLLCYVSLQGGVAFPAAHRCVMMSKSWLWLWASCLTCGALPFTHSTPPSTHPTAPASVLPALVPSTSATLQTNGLAGVLWCRFLVGLEAKTRGLTLNISLPPCTACAQYELMCAACVRE